MEATVGKHFNQSQTTLQKALKNNLISHIKFTMNSTTNPTFILENANYIFGRFFDGFENVYLGEQRERTETLYVKSHRIGTLNQFRIDKEYSDAVLLTAASST